MALGVDVTEESAALRGAEHVEEGSLGHSGAAELTAPVVVEDAEFGPGPAELVESLHQTPDGAPAVEGLDVMAQGFSVGPQLVVTVDLAAHGQKRPPAARRRQARGRDPGRTRPRGPKS